MKLRIARKILVNGWPSDKDRPGLPSRRECAARRKVLRHWSRWRWPNGTSYFVREKAAHADVRALRAAEARCELRRTTS